MFERVVSLEINKAYADLKTALAKKGCRIIAEDPPKRISVKQGSLWGITPKTAKKNLDLTLVSVDSGTQVNSSSRLSSEWKNITLIGCVFAALLVALCLWMVFDLSSFMATQKPSFWSWLVTFDGSADLMIGHAFVNVTTGLAVFLSVVILLEIAITVYVHSRIDRFAQETLNSLPN